ncbi:MAG TPA: peptidase [Methylophilaceae bacterium]|nr:peptidase [Methylophilaceae bacterium]
MRKILLFTWILFSILCASLTFAEVVPPPQLAVNAYLLKDFNSGSTIAAYKENERVEPASLTKIMTAYLTFEAIQQHHLKLDQTLPVSEKAWKAEGSKMFIEPKTPVTVDELLHGLIIQSGNDAAITLAENIAGSESQFADLMNKKAASLGMKNTHFMNATGLPDKDHYTTAYDLSILASALIHDFPLEYKTLYSTKEYTYNKITQPNRNRLLWLDANVDGMKTGHTNTAGYCLIASAKRNETRLVSVVLGAVSETSRAVESQKLLNYGFQYFETTQVYHPGQPISALHVWKGQEKTVNATVATPVYFSLPKGDYAKVKASMTTKQPLIAPIKTNQTIGKITFKLDGKILAEHALVAANDIEVGNFFSRMIDNIKLMMQ